MTEAADASFQLGLIELMAAGAHEAEAVKWDRKTAGILRSHAVELRRRGTARMMLGNERGNRSTSRPLAAHPPGDTQSAKGSCG